MGRVTVVDADVLADFLNREGAWEAVQAHIRARTIATAAIAAFEVWCGLHTEHARAAFRDVLRPMKSRIYPVEARTAARAGELFRELGLGKGQRDCLIAATCLERRAPILTGNWRHFERVPGLAVIRAR